MEDLKNPLSIPTVDGLLVAILNVAIVIAVPIVVLFLIFAGFQYITAKGNPEKIQEATRALTYGIIGGVIIIGSVAITEIVKSVATAF